MKKDVSKTTFVWSHVGVILFHVLLGILILYSMKAKKKVLGLKPDTMIRTTAWLLIIVSLLGLIPILANTEYTIE